MKNSLKKLRGLAQHRHAASVGEVRRRGGLSLAQVDEVSRASQDIVTIRACYENLLSASAAAANSAYEFSESLREMGDCLLENTALIDDEESGNVLLMLGKLQYELQKTVDKYRSHIFQTITVPSESLLNELHTVEEMKRQCDEKREAYEYMVTRYKEKLKNRSAKGDNFTIEQIQAAHDEYDDDATLFVFRIKSLKKGQPRSLLTQAARHHAAQLWFFKKALKSLEVVDPPVRKIAEQQHVDCHLSENSEGSVDSGNDNDAEDDETDYKPNDDGELDNNAASNHGEVIPTSKTLMDVDLGNFPPRGGASGLLKEISMLKSRKSFSYKGGGRNITQSAPLLNEERIESADKLRQMRTSFTRKSISYALPTPNTKASSAGLVPSPSVSDPPDSAMNKVPPVLRDSNFDTLTSRLPPMTDRIMLPMPESSISSDSKKLKRYSFSGPISPIHSASVDQSHLFSAPLLQTRLAKSPPKVSPYISSSAAASSPRISELHELPRPPGSKHSKPSRPVLIGHSAPLVPKEHTQAPPSRSASQLPTPSQAVTRSFSIPSGGSVSVALPQQKRDDVSSPPLPPIPVSNA